MVDLEVEERRARMRLQEARAVHKQRLDFLTAGMLLLLLIVGVATVLLPTAPTPEEIKWYKLKTPSGWVVSGETQAWARTFLTAIGGALVGFIARRSGGAGSSCTPNEALERAGAEQHGDSDTSRPAGHSAPGR